jgi:hypothetical protein
MEEERGNLRSAAKCATTRFEESKEADSECFSLKLRCNQAHARWSKADNDIANQKSNPIEEVLFYLGHNQVKKRALGSWSFFLSFVLQKDRATAFSLLMQMSDGDDTPVRDRA